MASSATKHARNNARVLFVIHSLGFGGAERVVVDFAKNLDRTCYEADVCVLSERLALAGELSGSGVGLHVLPKRSRFDAALVARLAGLMRRLRPDVVSMHCRDAFHFATPACLLAGVPVRIATEHSVSPGTNEKLNRLAYRMSVPTWTATVAVSDYLRSFMIRTWSVPSERIRVIHNGVDFSRFRAPDRQALRTTLGIPPGAGIVGNVGTLKKEKGHKEFLNAAASILAAGVDAHFVIIGDGPSRAELTRQAASAGVLDRTHFLGARLDAPELAAGFDVFLCTSEVETFGLAIVEAMYMGVPVVAFDVGSIGEIVADGSSGFLVPPGDSPAACSRVISILASEDVRRTMGQSAHAGAVERFSVSGMIRSYEKLFFREA